jgi:PAS domain S-box-containing protein
MKSQYEYLVSLLERSHNFYLIFINMEGNYEYANKSFKDRFGFLRTDFLGKSCMQDVHPDDHAEVNTVVANCFQHPGVFKSVVIRKPVAEDEYVITDWDFIAITEANGIPEGIMCIGYEITGYLRTIEDNRKTIKEMIHQQSHTIRRPIANIKGLVNLFDLDTLTEENKHLLDLIKASSDDLDDIIINMAKN